MDYLVGLLWVCALAWGALIMWLMVELLQAFEFREEYRLTIAVAAMGSGLLPGLLFFLWYGLPERIISCCPVRIPGFMLSLGLAVIFGFLQVLGGLIGGSPRYALFGTVELVAGVWGLAGAQVCAARLASQGAGYEQLELTTIGD